VFRLTGIEQLLILLRTASLVHLFIYFLVFRDYQMNLKIDYRLQEGIGNVEAFITVDEQCQ